MSTHGTACTAVDDTLLVDQGTLFYLDALGQQGLSLYSKEGKKLKRKTHDFRADQISHNRSVENPIQGSPPFKMVSG
jgi:hypothetical protein